MVIKPSSAARVRIDAPRWLFKKLVPKKYGNGNRTKPMNQGVRTSREIGSIARSASHAAGAFD